VFRAILVCASSQVEMKRVHVQVQHPASVAFLLQSSNDVFGLLMNNAAQGLIIPVVPFSAHRGGSGASVRVQWYTVCEQSG